MGHRARVDPAAVGLEPGAGSRGHRERAREFRGPDALARGGGGEFLADPPIGVMALTFEVVLPGRASSSPESRDSGLDASHRPGMTTAPYPTLRNLRYAARRPSRSALTPYRVIV